MATHYSSDAAILIHRAKTSGCTQLGQDRWLYADYAISAEQTGWPDGSPARLHDFSQAPYWIIHPTQAPVPIRFADELELAVVDDMDLPTAGQLGMTQRVAAIAREEPMHPAADSALQLAARHGLADVVKILAPHCNVEARNTALLCATYGAHTEAVRVLLPHCTETSDACRIASEHGYSGISRLFWVHRNLRFDHSMSL